MELTNNLKLLLVQAGPHTNAQAVVDNIENTESHWKMKKIKNQLQS